MGGTCDKPPASCPRRDPQWSRVLVAPQVNQSKNHILLQAGMTLGGFYIFCSCNLLQIFVYIFVPKNYVYTVLVVPPKMCTHFNI